MKFLVDNQLPTALVRFLASLGAECVHALDLNLGQASDAEIWDYAGRNGYVVFSKDEDFLYLAKKASTSARLIWVRIGNCRNKELLAAIHQMWPRILAALQAGERIVEIR